MRAMKVSTRYSMAGALRGLAAVAGLALLSACGDLSVPRAGGDDGVAVDPNSTVAVALLAPPGSADPNLQRIARDLVNAGRLAGQDVRNADIDLRVYRRPRHLRGRPGRRDPGGRRGRQDHRGPPAQHRDRGRRAGGAGGRDQHPRLLQQPQRGGPGTYLLGVTPGAAANSLVSFARTRGLSNFGVLYVQGETAEVVRDSVDLGREPGRRARGLDPGLSLFAAGRERHGPDHVRDPAERRGQRRHPDRPLHRRPRWPTDCARTGWGRTARC